MAQRLGYGTASGRGNDLTGKSEVLPVARAESAKETCGERSLAPSGLLPVTNGMSGKDLHNQPEFDSVPTPDWLMRLFDGFHDPYPLGVAEPIEPPAGARVFVNPGYSRKLEAARKCVEWHKAGHYVVMLVPIETSTLFAKQLIQYGVERLYFEHRPFPNCRGVELVILRGKTP